jgi:hypothetical protein
MIWNRPKRARTTLGDMTSRIKGFILDSQVTEGEHISLLLGCSPASEEVAERELEESDNRVAQVDHLIPLMYAYCHAMAQGMVEHQQSHASEEELEQIPQAAWGATRKVFSQVALNSMLGAVSQMVHLGLLTVNPKK